MNEKDVLEAWERSVEPRDDLEKEAYEIIGQSLEKRIPQKPMTTNHYYACPSCGSCRSIRRKYDYCQNCGQAIDWEN